MEAQTRAGRGIRLLARCLAGLMLAAPVGMVGCGGSVGVANGSIVGRVFGNASGGSASPAPLAGVTVSAERMGATPPVIRTTVTDQNGEFVFANAPTGLYQLGYSRRGFQTIDTDNGASNNPVPQGQQIEVFVEPSSTGIAPDVTLAKLPDEGDSTIVVTLVDNISGQAVTNATVTIGAATTSNGGVNGVYTLSVPIRQSGGGDGANEAPPLQQVIISADGYVAEGVAPPQVRPIANETVSVTVRMDPILARITGFIQISQFQTLYDLTMIGVTADSVPSDSLGGGQGVMVSVEPTGFFTAFVPASNSALTRQINLTFTAPNLQTRVVSNIVAPTAHGVRQLTSPVVMQPLTVDLVGTVVDSSGNAPNQLNPQGIPDTVTVQETGQVGNIINGAYTIADVPVTSSITQPAAFTLQVSAFNPNAVGPTGPGRQETATQPGISPVSDGTPNPVFTVPTIVTN